jgi:hypothetical protein
MLICALFLMFDLADDGRLGRVRFVAPQTPVKSLNSAASHYCAAKSDSQNELSRADILRIPSQFPIQPATFVVHQTRKIIVSCHLSSAGGLPW